MEGTSSTSCSMTARTLSPGMPASRWPELFDDDLMRSVRFASSEERVAYARRLSECSPVPAEVLEYGLLLSKGYTLGQNRNALLLDSAGTLFLCVDDDTICTSRLPPGASDEVLRTCSGADPSEFWCFRDFAEASASVPIVENDLLEAHERLLGKNVAELPLCGEHASSGDGGQTSGLLKRVTVPREHREDYAQRSVG